MKRYNAFEFTRRYGEVSRELGGTVVVSGGGALVMLGLRNTTADLDLDVTEAVFNKHRTPDNTVRYGDTEIINYSDDTSLQLLDPTRKTRVIRGVEMYSNADLIAQKELLIACPNRHPDKIAQDRLDLKALIRFFPFVDLLPDVVDVADPFFYCGWTPEEMIAERDKVEAWLRQEGLSRNASSSTPVLEQVPPILPIANVSIEHSSFLYCSRKTK